MATNADDTAANDSTKVTGEDLRKLKYGEDEVESSTETDESSETNETDDSTETRDDDETNSDTDATDETEESDTTESDDDSAAFVKELPNIQGDTLEEYARSLEKAYQNSTAEALRLKGLVDGAQTDKRVGDNKEETTIDTTDPLALYAKQKMDEEINASFNAFSKSYPQVTDPTEYNRFTVEVATLSNTILQSQKRLASPQELYQKAAVILGWEPDKVTSKDRVNAAIKGSAAVSKTTSTTKQVTKSKVTDQMVALNRMMYPGKTDEQIRKELEPYVK